MGNQLAGFKVVGAAFGMAENNVSAADIRQHGRADVAGVSALDRKMGILRTERDLGTAQRFFNLIKQRKRRTNKKFACRFAQFLYFGGNFSGQRNSVFGEAVHFPVAGNHDFSSHYFFLKMF